MTQAFDGRMDPALADAIDSIKATHEDEFPRGQEPDGATDADAVSGVPTEDGAETSSDTTTSGAPASGAPTGEDHG